MKLHHVVARSALVFRGEAISHKIRKLFQTEARRPRKDTLLFLLFSFILFSCTASPQPVSQTEIVTVYAAPSAEPWMSDLFACANDLSVVLNVSAESPEIYLRLGEPEILISPAYQIDEEEILIVTNRESPVQNLSLQAAQDLFAGRGDASLQVWVYSSDADMQILFDQLVMKGRSVTSFARVAVSPQVMSDVLISESNSVGILPRHWVTGGVREVFSAGVVPVLAVTKQEPQGVVKELIGCLQND